MAPRARVARIPRPVLLRDVCVANWTASLHTAVPSIVFDWERHIPFLPWTIVPYWIIDALYGISLFLCASKRELDTHALRLLTAQVVAVACFIAFPHRFTFAHPPADGVFGALFDVLLGFDRPFNQAAIAAHRTRGDPVDAVRAQDARRAARRGRRRVRDDLRIGADDLPAPLHRHPDGIRARVAVRLALA